VAAAPQPLRAVTAGAGPPLVLLPGFGLSPLAYLRVVDRLAPTHRVLVPWVWGAGPRWSYEAAVGAVLATLEAQDVERAAVVGHSMGGAVALGVAAAEPARTSALVLVNALALSPGRSRLARLGLQGRHIRTFATVATARDFVGWAARRPGDVVATALWGWSCDLADAAAAVRSAGVPRSVLWGEDDSLLPLTIGEELAGALDAPLRVASGRSPEERVEHDWVYRHPTFFSRQLHAALAVAGPA
jgi:pimeloyl-ACP methyl ester carboxylesterase